MKRGLTLYLLVLALILPACQESGTTSRGAASRTAASLDQLRTENRELRERNAHLERVNEQQSQMLTLYTGKLNRVLDALDAIGGRQNEIDRMLTHGAEGSFSTRSEIDERLRSGLAEIEEHLRTSRMHQSDMRRLADRAGGEASGIAASIERLNRLLIGKEREIQDLRRRVAEREAARQPATADEKDRQIGRRESEPRQAFYVIGTYNELRALVREGVLQRQRSDFAQGLYRVGSDKYRYRLRRLDTTAQRVVIGAHLRRVKIVSLHQSDQRLYRFVQEGDETVLVINDPLQFWNISRDLILQVER